jgi:hypothetical protein
VNEVKQQASMVGAARRTDPDELEAGLNQLIERRARENSPKDAANEREARWKASEREYHDELDTLAKRARDLEAYIDDKQRTVAELEAVIRK